MKRFWLLFKTEWKVWRKDPITALGGVIPTMILFIAFAVLFGGDLGFKIAVINHDQGIYGDKLVNTFQNTISPLGNSPYYRLTNLPEEEAWHAYHQFRLEGIWVIPENFSAQLDAGLPAEVEMVFSNYNDDRAKNHRIYASEILWQFYKEIDIKQPSFKMEETYPQPEMVEWFPVIGVGIILLGATLGGMINIFMLTHKEKKSGMLLEIGLAPVSLVSFFLAKLVLALLMAILTGTLITLILYIWIGSWLAVYPLLVVLLWVLVSIFWIMAALLLGLVFKQYMAGAVTLILTGVVIFFSGGGMNLIRTREAEVSWWNWCFPNIYALDPLRDLLIFRSMPVDISPVLIRLALFAAGSLIIGFLSGNRIIRKKTS